MVYDDLRIALERRKRLKDSSQPENKQEMKRHWISSRISIMVPAKTEEIKQLENEHCQGDGETISVMRMPEHEADFVFCFRGIPLLEKETSLKVRNSIKNMIMRLYPANTFYSEGAETIGEQEACWFDFDSFGIDGEIYNFMFTFPILSRQEFLICSFHCMGSQAENWKSVFMEMLLSLEEDGNVCIGK